ncbi:hypothetical protein DNG35_03505 [Mesonia sp. K7]|nr:hypothetical protein DNG35_03505 [Mesonia sp. K7]
MGAYYNTLYNGKLALEDGQAELAQTYFDNYWEILPVEQMMLKDDTDTTTNQNFERAEEKATKAIQKHNMSIEGTEYNPQMDKAFILLGKSRYYDQRFFPALEAFNYVITDYPESNQFATARVWREKTNMRMGNYEIALKNLKELLQDTLEIDEEDLTHTYATMTQLHINLEHLDSAKVAIDSALAYVDDNEKKGRYLFIKGQLLNRLGEKDSANKTFDEIIALKRRTPRIYYINAFLQKARNYDLDNQDQSMLEETLTELEENRENRPYLDIIYFQKAEYYREIDSLDRAVVYYNKSLRTDTQDANLKYRTYLTLGNLNFDDAQYKIAGNYYDSTLTNLSEGTREYRLIRKKRENLEDVILYEDIAVKNDSILRLVNFSESERLAYFEEYTKNLKEQALEDLKASQNAAPTNLFGKTPSSATSGGSSASAGSFYFYNGNQVAKGLLDFKRKWGDIELADNWRYEPKSIGKTSGSEEVSEEQALMTAFENDPQYDPATYLTTIPTDQAVIDSLYKDRNFAYYQLGIIYKEKFREYDLAIAKLEALLESNPEERLVIPSKYNLYKIYETIGDEVNANKWKNDIITNHPETRYASILKNPQALRDDQNNPENVYNAVYQKFLNQEYKAVIDESNENINLFAGNDIVPKFELLKATAQGRYDGFEAYKKGLNFVALNYPQSEEGKKAEELIKNTIPVLQDTVFTFPEDAKEYKLVYWFKNTPTDTLAVEGNTPQVADNKILEVKKKIDEAILEFGYEDLKTSIDFYDENQKLLVVHGLKSLLGAKGFGVKLSEEKKYKITIENVAIASEDYKKVQVHKSLEAYKSSFQEKIK